MFEYVVILAAGKGERLKPLTTYVPKPLIYKNEIMLMTRALKAVASINNIYVTVHYKSKIIRRSQVIVIQYIEFEINWNKLYNEYIERKIDHMLVPVYPQAMPQYFCEGDMIYGENGLVKDISRNKVQLNEIGLCSGIQVINPSKFPTNHLFIDAWKVLAMVEKLNYSMTTPKIWSCVDRIEQI